MSGPTLQIKLRSSELMEISPETRRLIAGSVTDAELEVNGETIPISPNNWARPEPSRAPKVAALWKLLTAFLDGATTVGRFAFQRAELIALLEEGTRGIATLSGGVRRNTFVRR